MILSVAPDLSSVFRVAAMSLAAAGVERNFPAVGSEVRHEKGNKMSRSDLQMDVVKPTNAFGAAPPTIRTLLAVSDVCQNLQHEDEPALVSRFGELSAAIDAQLDWLDSAVAGHEDFPYRLRPAGDALVRELQGLQQEAWSLLLETNREPARTLSRVHDLARRCTEAATQAYHLAEDALLEPGTGD
jgi:hypothetical protein